MNGVPHKWRFVVDSELFAEKSAATQYLDRHKLCSMEVVLNS